MPIRNPFDRDFRRSQTKAFRAARRLGTAVHIALTLALMALQSPARAAEPPTTPMLRIEPGMHTAMINRIDADASGQFLVTGADDKTARVWSLATGELLTTLRPPAGAGDEGKLYAVAMSPQGALVAAAGWTCWDFDSQACIYLFDRASGRLLRRLGGLPTVINHLAFSPDGRHLAAGLEGSHGVRIFDTASGRLVGTDATIGGAVYGLAWSSRSAAGSASKTLRLAGTSYDGKVRLWSVDAATGTLQKLAERPAPEGQRPVGIAFSPDGRRLAVGYNGVTTVALLDGTTLEPVLPRAASDSPGMTNGDFGSVAWQADGPGGPALWAAGRYSRAIEGRRRYLLRRWPLNPDGTLGAASDTPIADDTVMSLAPLPGGRLAFGSAAPDWGVVDGEGHLIRYQSAATRSFDSEDDPQLRLELAGEGQALRIGQLSFDLATRRFGLPIGAALNAARTAAPGLDLRDWQHEATPTLNGRPLPLKPYESARSLAIAADGQSFVLGASWSLRRIDASGRELWQQPVPGTVWAVNLAAAAKGGETAVVAAYGDGTIRWHRWSDGKELLALFAHPDHRRWVLWTPNGYFDASRGAEDLIGWQVNQGKDTAARFVKGGQLYAKLYRPDLIARAAAGEDSASFPAVNLEALLATGDAPKVILLAPVAGPSASRDVALKYRVCDAGGGIGQRVLRINGMTVALAEGDRGLKPGSGPRTEDCLDEEKLISLQPGANTIAVSAFNKAGQIESSPVELKLAFQSSAPAGAKPTLHVLALAVDQYRDGDLRLAYSKKDAQGLIDNLKQVGIQLFGEIRVHTLFDDQVRKVGVGNKFDQLATLIKPEDVFVLYLAGHGVTDREDGNYYFLPVDFRYSDQAAVRNQAISNAFFQENLAKIKAGKSLVLLDTCNSGSFQAVKTRGVEEKTAVARLVKATGRATIMASSSSQVALEGYQGHGIFTWALIEGLKGKAAQGGQITVGSLADYVGDTLPELTYRKFGYEQVPQRELQGMNFPIGVR